MKNKLVNFLIAVVIGGSLLTFSSCGGSNGKGSETSSSLETETTTDAIAEVTAFANDFVAKLTAGQLDSLKASYPVLAGATDLVPVKGDSVLVLAATTPGEYDVTLSDGITMKISHSPDGSITINETRGLYSFPNDKKEIAMKTGMWDNSLNDAQLAERMNDDAFFKYIKTNKKVNSRNIIKIGEFHDNFVPQSEDDFRGTAVYDGYQKLTNTTGSEIKGSDYSLVYHVASYWGGEVEEEWTEVKPGKTIPAHGSVKVDAAAGYHGGSVVQKIKWKLSDAQLQEKFAPYTGNEYQEYLNSKK